MEGGAVMEDVNILKELVANFGTAGLIIAYLVWDRNTTAKERREIDAQQIASNIRLAESLVALKTLIERIQR
jgi:hypothetical protein